MTEPESTVRNGVRAVIIQNGRVLLLRKEYEDGSERYVLPGGSQDPGETLSEALQRECREEIGSEVDIRALLYLADFFKPRSSVPGTVRQQVEFMFECDSPPGYEPHNGHRPDRHQVAVVWVSQRDLARINLFPSSLKALLAERKPAAAPVYLGLINA